MGVRMLSSVPFTPTDTSWKDLPPGSGMRTGAARTVVDGMSVLAHASSIDSRRGTPRARASLKRLMSCPSPWKEDFCTAAPNVPHIREPTVFSNSSSAAPVLAMFIPGPDVPGAYNAESLPLTGPGVGKSRRGAFGFGDRVEYAHGRAARSASTVVRRPFTTVLPRGMAGPWGVSNWYGSRMRPVPLAMSPPSAVMD